MCHPHDRPQTTHLQQEKEQCRSSNIYRQYFSELWLLCLKILCFTVKIKTKQKNRNWYDIISILLLIAVVCTHIADVLNHSEALAINQNRIFAITVIVVSLRVFEIGRFVNQVNSFSFNNSTEDAFFPFQIFSFKIKSLGVLIIILIFCMRKVIVWIIVFAIFWLPFSKFIYFFFKQYHLKKYSNKKLI